MFTKQKCLWALATAGFGVLMELYYVLSGHPRGSWGSVCIAIGGGLVFGLIVANIIGEKRLKKWFSNNDRSE